MTIADIPPEGLPLPGAERYLLRKLLGRGGFGDAYLADDKALARRVVVKLLMNLTEPTIRERFTREARIAANIHHAAVVQVHDIGALPDGRPFFVMEFVDGMSLTDYIKQRGAHLALSHALTLLAEAAEGLAVAHRMSVIHRDIKPDNILVTKTGHAKLIDFGIAKKAVQEADSSTVKQTSVGTVLGTPRYISPEQATAKVLAGASDLYSLGCVMYVMLTGRSPFEGSPQELMMHHVYTPPPTLAAATPGRTFPPEIEGMVGRLLAKDPLRRYQNGDDLAAALRTAAALARANEETDATAALPSLAGEPTHKELAATGATFSSIESSASNLTPPPTAWDGATDNLSQMGMSPLPAPGPAAPRAWGKAEGDHTAALDAPASLVRKDDSFPSPMPVMEDLTGRTQPRSSGRAMVVVGVLILVFSAIGGTAFVMSRRGASGGPPTSPPLAKTDEKPPGVAAPSGDIPAGKGSAALPAETAAPSVESTTTAPPKSAAVGTTPKAVVAPTSIAKTTGMPAAKATAPSVAAPPPGTTAQPKPAATSATPPPPVPNSGTAIDDRL